jgi:hypothetical protein
MKPSEYIASIKAQKPKRAITQADIPNWIDADLQHIGPTVDEAVRKINERDFVVDYLLPNLGPRLPPELRDLITDGAIAMGEIEDPSPNAHVERIDGRICNYL